MRQLVILLPIVVLLVACSKHVPHASTDAGQRPQYYANQLPKDAGTTAAERFGRRRPDFSKSPPADVPILPAKPAKPNGHVQSCLDKKFPEWAPLEQCLKNKPPTTGKYAAGTRPPIPCPTLEVTEWDLNASTGSNNNTCVDAAHPCQTFAELQSRWACGGTPETRPVFPQGVSIFVHADSQEYFTLDLELPPNPPGYAGAFVIQCDTTTIGSGTLASVVSKNRSAGQQLTADLGGSEPSFLQFQINNTTRSGLGWVDATLTGTTALLTQPLNSGGSEVDTYASTDAFNVLRPVQISPRRITGHCGANECFQTWPGSGGYPKILNCWRPAHSGVTDMMELDRVSWDQGRIDVGVWGTAPTFHNTIITTAPGTGTYPFVTPQLYAGSITSAGSATVVGIQFAESNNIGSWIYHDTNIHGMIGGADTLSIESAYCDNLPNAGSGLWALPIPSWIGPTATNTPNIYGHCEMLPQFGGFFTYQGSALSLFSSGITIGYTTAFAWDYGHTPSLPSLRSLSWAQMDTSYAAGGFSGYAELAAANGFIFDWSLTLPSANPPSIVWQPGQGGTGDDAGCPAGTVLIGGGSGPVTCGTTQLSCPSNDLLVGTGNLGGISCSNPAPANGNIAEFVASNPSTIFGGTLKLWLESNVGVTQSGGLVSTWTDQSGNANNATASGGHNPGYVSNGGPNGSPQVTFPSTTFLSSTTNVVASGATRTLWVVGTPQPNNPSAVFTFKLGTPYATMETASNGAPTSYVYSDGVSVANNVSTNAPNSSQLIQWVYTSGSTITYYLNGTSETVSGGNVSSDTGTSGYQISGNSNGQWFGGDIEEIIVIDHVASTSERNAVGGYIQNKYGLTIAGATPVGWTPESFTDGGVLLGGGPTGPIRNVSATCTAGQLLECNGGTDPTWQTVTSGVSSVTGGGSVSCSPTTGAVVCTGSGNVTSVTGSGLVSCSPTTGSVTCSATDPVTVPHGGTGDNTLANHGVVIGQGTSAVAVVSSGETTNKLFIAQTSADPIWSAYTLDPPGASGTTLKSNGTNWIATTYNTPSTISSCQSHGTPTTLTGSYAAMTNCSITVSGSTVNCMGSVNWDLSVGSSTISQQVDWGLQVDSTTSVSQTRDLVNPNGGVSNNFNISMSGSTSESYAPSAGSHTFYVLAKDISTLTGLANNTITADLICLQH